MKILVKAALLGVLALGLGTAVSASAADAKKCVKGCADCAKCCADSKTCKKCCQ